MMKTPLFDLNYDDEEIHATREVIEAKWISMGPKTQQLEKRFASFIGTSYGVALSSCTAALHLALKVMDIGPGDEVIVPSLTFVATVNAVHYVRATPVFADVTSLDDWTISPEDIRRKITSKTKAIIVMHYAGFGCDMGEILDIAQEYGLKIVEDACHAPGGIWKEKRLGTVGHCSCYSFYSNKHISTGEGGMLLTNSQRYSERAKNLRAHGMTALAIDRKDGCQLYDILEIGYNYRIDDIRSSLGLVQLEKLPLETKLRNQVANLYKRLLSKNSSVLIPFGEYDGWSPYYIFPIFLKEGKRSRFRNQLMARNIETSVHYPPVHLFKCYEEFTVSLPKTEQIGRNALSLPMFAALTENTIKYICETVNEVIAS